MFNLKKALSFLLSAVMLFCFSVTGITVTAEEVIKVACVGDSITEGFTSSNNSVYSYPARLQMMLGDGYEVKNYGLGGRTAGKETSSPYWNEAYYTESLNSNPDIVIIMLGTNDAAANNEAKLGTYEEHMTELVESYVNLPSNPTVYLCTAPKCGDQTQRANNVPNVIIPAQKRIAESLGINLVSVYEWSVENYQYFPDNLHPNDTGYSLMAQFFYEEIFGGTLYDITVKGEEGAVCSSFGQTYTIDETGEFSFKLHEGAQTVSLKKAGYDRHSITLNVPEETLADFTQFDLVENLALSGTAFDQGQYEYYAADRGPAMVNDGDFNSSWQLKGGDYFNNSILTGIYLGIEFNTATAFDRMVITWELGSRCTKDGYRLEYSDDNENWNVLDFSQAILNENEDTLTFDQITAKYVRIVLIKATNSKYTPRVFEVEIYNDNNGGTVTPPETIVTKGDINGDGKVNSTDFMQVRRHFLGLYEIPEEKFEAADTNGDGSINSTDFMQIRRHFLGLYNLYE